MKYFLLSMILISIMGGCSAIDRYNDDVTDRHLKDGFQSPYTNEDYPPGTVINGYTLPSEPDHTENDKTLLGIDVNNNGMRDDIERFIIIKESKHTKYPKTWTSINLQLDRGVYHYYKTNEIKKYHEAIACLNGFSNYMSQKNIYVLLDKPYISLSSDDMVNLEVNTPERKSKDAELEDALNDVVSSGHDLPHSTSYCDDDLFSFGELP